jgi:hypothetical protein
MIIELVAVRRQAGGSMSRVDLHQTPHRRTLARRTSIVRPTLRASSAGSPEIRQRDLDRLIKRSRREQERNHWELLRERRPVPHGRPNPTDEAERIWHQEADKTSILRLLCGACPATRARPVVGQVFATPNGLLLVAIYAGPDSKRTGHYGNLRSFRTGQWITDSPRPFAARCGRCHRFYVDATGGIVAEVKDRLRRGEKGHWVVDQRYLCRTTEPPGL